MKRAIYVDYENVNISGLKGIEELTHDDVVKIFIGAQASKLTMVDANRIFNCEASVELITNKYIGKNALDFIIMVHMGYDIAQGLAKSYYIISKDKGYDPAIHEMRKMSGLTVARREDIVAVLDEKKSFGRRIKGILGFGKVKETPDTTEHTVVGKGKKDSNEFSRITKDYVKDDDSKPGKKNKNSRPKKTKENLVKENKTEEKKPSRGNKPEEKKAVKGRKAEEKKPVKERNFEDKKVTASGYAGKKQASEAAKKEIEKPIEKPVGQVENSDASTGVDKQENRNNRNYRNNNRNNRYNNRNRKPKPEKESSEKVENQPEVQVEQPSVNQSSQKQNKQKESRKPEVVEKMQPEVKEDLSKEVSKTEIQVKDTIKKDVSVEEPVSEVQTQQGEASEEKKDYKGNYHRNHHGRGRGHYNNHRGHNRNHHSNDGEKRVDGEMPVEKPAPVVKSPEEIERERQRSEAFALLAELDEQENNNTQFSYKKYK